MPLGFSQRHPCHCRRARCGDPRARPVSAKTLAARHKLPRAISIRFCKRWCARASRAGVRGPHGGYELAGEHRRISAEDILRTAEDANNSPLPNSALANDVVNPALVEAARKFSLALGRISVEDMAKRADALK
jgi:DNA-binding IscR family transcriptional regulator